MTRLARIACGALFCSWLLPPTAFAAETPKRLAVMDFENATADKTLNWLGQGIAETLITELSRIQDLTLVERRRLQDALKEIKLGRSEAVDQATAQRMGKVLGADAVVVGSFQKPQDTLRFQARVVDVETGTIRWSARVDGKDILELQIDLAKKLVEAMKGSLADADKRRLEVAPVPSKNVDALRAYSDGVYFYRNDLAQDAVVEFDRALALDPNYVEAHFYKGMALAKLKRFDDAITSFKRTLPRTQEEHRVKWRWDVPFEADGSARSVFPAFDLKAFTQDLLSRGGPVRAQKRLVYTERSGKNTIFHFVDLEQRSAKRLELPDAAAIRTGWATDRLTVVLSATLAGILSGNMSIHGIDPADGSLLWHSELTDLGGFPMLAVADRVVWEYLPPLHRLVALNDVTLQPKWQRNDLDLEFALPIMKSTRSSGELLIVKSGTERKIHAIRVADGQDSWTADLQSARTYQMAADQALIVFEPDRGVFALDFETGKPLFDLPVRQITQAHKTAIANFETVAALAHEGTLYFSSDAGELLAVDLDRATPAERRVRWKTPLNKKVVNFSARGSRLYVATDSGEFLILDAKSGNVLASRRIADKDLGVDYAGDEIVVASSDESVFGLDPITGIKQWDHPSNPRALKPLYFKGAVILQTSGTQISALDARTGTVIWQYVGKLAQSHLFIELFGAVIPSVYLTDDSFFIVEQGGVKEYAIERSEGQGITNKEALTELAGALLSKGDLAEASRFAGTAREADPNFPPLRLLQARLEQARGNVAGARRELVTYVDLAGRQSRSGQDIVAELKREHGLIWQTESGKAVAGSLLIEGKKLLSVGRVAGSDAQVALLDAISGRVLWRQNAERVLDVVYAPDSRRVLFVRGQNSDPRTVQLNAVDLDTNNRTELARITAPFDVKTVSISYASDRIFVATTALDVPAQKAAVRITCFNATSGKRLWEIPHDFTAVNFQDVIVPVGLFYPKKEFLVYSIGRDLWVIRADDGTIYAQHHENAFIVPKYYGVDDTSGDVTYLGTVANELVGYNLTTRQIVLRTSVPDVDTQWVNGAWGISDDTQYNSDGRSIFAFDVSPNAAVTDRVKWRIKANQDRQFSWWFRSGEYVWALRDDNVLLQVDRSTGTILNEYPLLWVPADFSVEGDRLYAFTADGQAYAMQLKAIGK